MKAKYILIALLIGFLTGCTDNYEEFNTDTKNPAEVEGEALFSYAQKELTDQISNTNVNLNVWKLFAQYWTETTYTDEANYDIINRTIADNAFESYYQDVLKHLDQARLLISEKPVSPPETEASKANKLAIIDIMMVYSYHNLVNIFGNVPYTEALNTENINPAYDDARTIYDDLVTRLNNDLGALNASSHSFGSADLIYGGDVASWVKFANSLKLKIGINLADVDAGAAQTIVEEAVSAGVLSSSADNAEFHYLGATPNTNPLYEDLVLSGRSDFVVANTIVDLMNGLADPRRDLYFDNKIEGEYVGGLYGESNSFPNFSHIDGVVQSPDFPGILLTYDEVQFYIAEAAARGWSVGQTAEDAYNEAVTASILWWGGTETQATDYLAEPDVAFATAGTWEEAIGTQSYIAFYTRGFVAFTQYRRFDLPQMNVAPSAETGGPVPTRFTYPVAEQTLNTVSYQEASTAIGGDDLLTRIFWDTEAP